MIESRTYDNTWGQPVVVLVATGSDDVSRLVHTLKGAPPVVEQLIVGERVVRQLRRHNTGRAALELLAQHGGADFTAEASPRDEEALRVWLLSHPDWTIFRSQLGPRSAWQLNLHDDTYGDPAPALLHIGNDKPFPLIAGHRDLRALASAVPFTALEYGKASGRGQGVAE